MSLRYAVLGLLAEKPASGYDLMRQFDNSLANVWPATQSQVYGELAKLAENGLATVDEGGARGRKEYAITDDGRAELLHWLIQRPPNQPRRNEVLLRVFFLGMTSPAEARAFFDRGARNMGAYHDELRTLEKETSWDGPLSTYGRIALEWGLRFTAMHREWAEWAAAQVPEE